MEEIKDTQTILLEILTEIDNLSFSSYQGSTVEAIYLRNGFNDAIRKVKNIIESKL